MTDTAKGNYCRNPRDQEKAVQRAIRDYSRHNLRDYPWRKQQLSPFQVLVCEILLKRTHADTIANCVTKFLYRFTDPAKIALTSESDLIELLSPVGLQNQRARQLKLLAAFLLQNEGGQVPDKLDRLLGVPGIGGYTARAILSFGYDKPYAIVDSNVLRVYGRVFRERFGERPKLPQIQELADALLPPKDHKQYNLALLDLGAVVCGYPHPKCDICPLQKICDTAQDLRS